MSTTEFSPALSRRRILQGAAWATPAILIATAAPAAAASPPVLGGINLVSVSGIQDSSVLTVAATTTYQGEGPRALITR